MNTGLLDNLSVCLIPLSNYLTGASTGIQLAVLQVVILQGVIFQRFILSAHRATPGQGATLLFPCHL